MMLRDLTDAGLAPALGYSERYVRNVINGAVDAIHCTPARRKIERFFRTKFWSDNSPARNGRKTKRRTRSATRRQQHSTTRAPATA
jgi:hypothetical protein